MSSNLSRKIGIPSDTFHGQLVLCRLTGLEDLEEAKGSVASVLNVVAVRARDVTYDICEYGVFRMRIEENSPISPAW